MGKSIVEVRCHSVRADKDIPVIVTIEAPEKHTTSSDYYCRVASSDPTIGFRLDVYGITPQQAIRLALEMTAAKVANILSLDVTDESGDSSG